MSDDDDEELDGDEWEIVDEEEDVGSGLIQTGRQAAAPTPTTKKRRRSMPLWRRCWRGLCCCTNIERAKWNFWAYFQFLVLPLALFLLWLLVPIGAWQQPAQRCPPWINWQNATCRLSVVNQSSAQVGLPRDFKCSASFGVTVPWLCVYLAVGYFLSLLMLDILQPGCPAKYVAWTTLAVVLVTAASVAVLRYVVLPNTSNSEYLLLLPAAVNLLAVTGCYGYYVWVWAEERERMLLRSLFTRSQPAAAAPKLRAVLPDQQPDSGDIVLHRNRPLPRPPTFSEFDHRSNGTVTFAFDLDMPSTGDSDDNDDADSRRSVDSNPAVHDLARHTEDALNIWEVLRQERPARAAAADERTRLLSSKPGAPSSGLRRYDSVAPVAPNQAESIVSDGDGDEEELPPEIKQRLAAIRRLNRESWSHRLAHALFHIEARKVKRINEQLIKYSLLGTTAKSWTVWDQDNWESKLRLSFATVLNVVLLKLGMLATWVTLQVYIDEVIRPAQNSYFLFFAAAVVFLLMRFVIMFVLTALNNRLPSLPEIRYFVFFAGQMYFELAFRSLFLFAGNWTVIGAIGTLQSLITLWTYSFQLSPVWFNFWQIRCRAMACCRYTQFCFLDPDQGGHALTYESHIANKSIRFYYANITKAFSVLSMLLIFTLLYHCPWLLPYYPTLQLCLSRAHDLMLTYVLLAGIELTTGLLVYFIAWKIIKVDIGFHARIATILDSRTRFLFAVSCLFIYMDMPISLLRFTFS